MDDLSTIFRALADPTRIRIFAILRKQCWELDQSEAEDVTGPTVGAILREAGISGATLSYHLKELRHANLIRTERCGRKVMCCVNEGRLAEAASWLQAAGPGDCC